MKHPHLPLQFKFLLSIILIVVPLMGVVFTWAGARNQAQVTTQLVNQARVLARQVILTRQWIADCGGVLVDENSKGAVNTISFFGDRMETPRGTFLRITPSMATKRLSEYSARQDLYRFRLSSLSPLNPANLPDALEKEALERFMTGGATEWVRLKANGPKPYLHYVAPLYWQASCLDCHKMQDANPNGIGGGLSVFLPAEAMMRSVADDKMQLAVSGAALIVLTIATLFVLMRHVVIRPLRQLAEMTDQIRDGNLSARVAIVTGDEFEDLGRAFNNMAEAISKGRDDLEERIVRATRELSDANRELKTLDKLKSDFLANMSHELRSPLTVIRGGIDYLNRTILKDDNRNYLDIIDKNLNRLIHLVSDLFDFTKIESRKIDWSFSEENLSVLIREVIDITSPLALDRKVAVTYDHAGDDVYAEIDLERIEQVLVNLLDNAFKYSDLGTKVTIRTTRDDSFVTLAVQDQGIGILEENLETIFDKFSTVPSSDREGRTEGTGLGLAICKAIVEAHGGRIWARSRKGVSSTFFFTLPGRQDHRPPVDMEADGGREPGAACTDG